MVEATEFPELSSRYSIMGVPDTVINHGAGKIVGAVPDGRLMIEIKKPWPNRNRETYLIMTVKLVFLKMRLVCQARTG